MMRPLLILLSLTALTINVRTDTIIWTISDASLWTESGNITREETRTKCPTATSCWQLTGTDATMYRYFTIQSRASELLFQFNVRIEGFNDEDQHCSIQFSDNDEDDEQWRDLISFSGVQGDGTWTDQSSPRISVNSSDIGIKIALQNTGPAQSCYINGLQFILKS